jgi:hypothetical protein
LFENPPKRGGMIICLFMANTLLATEMDFWRRSARKSRKEKVRNVTIREIMEVGKDILEVTEEKRLRWFGRVKRIPGNRECHGKF